MNKFRIFVLTGIVALVLSVLNTNACTNFLVTKGASKDGSTMITYAADSHTLYGELYYRPAKDYPEGAMMDVIEWDTGKPMGKIKQARHTYSVIGNMNENQVAIGETTYGGRPELYDTTAIVDYGSMMYIALQRSKTAREAIKVMAELVAEYGYASEGESISVSDVNEVWIFEIIGKGSPSVGKDGKKIYEKGAIWVARRIPDGYISGHANQARITTFPFDKDKSSISSKNLNKIFDPRVETVYSYDIVTFARSRGYYKGEDKDFSFSDVYAPVNFEGARFCEGRVWAGFNKVNKNMAQYIDYVKGENLKNRMPLWIKPDFKLSFQDVKGLMRDHFEGTPFDMTKDVGAGPYECGYRWRPLTWKVNGKEYVNERATSTQQTGFSFVAQSRPNMPDKIGGIFWFSVDDSYSTVYVPMYCGITKIPEPYREGNGSMIEYSETSAFWIFNFVSNFCYLRYNVMIKDVQKVQSELENKFIAEVPTIDKQAMDAYSVNKEKAQEIINNYSNEQANLTASRYKKLGQYLLVKYMDGNIKKEKDGKFMTNGYTQSASPNQPGYPEWYLKKIVDDAGERLKVIEEPKK